jgi:apolipoprotein N-acyltransferase
MVLKRSEKLLLAIFSGLLLTASFPPGPFSWVAWIALVPLFKCLEGAPPRQAFAFGFSFGLAHNLTLVYWVVFVMQYYGNLPMPVSVGILVLFASYLALYPALFSFFYAYLREPFSCFKSAGLWVALEFVRANILTGFPWCLVGHTQYRDLPAIQIADLVGVYGISFIIILVNSSIYSLLFKRYIKRILTEIPATILLVVLTFGYGYHRLSEEHSPGAAIKVAIAQGNIDQSIKWNPSYQAKTIETYRTLTLSTKSFGPDLVVWPETAVPLFFQDGGKLAVTVVETARESGAYLIFGSPAYGRLGNSIHYYNRAYLVSPRGEVIDAYDKVHLVPFGEYVPLKRYLPFVHRLAVSAGDFRSGEKVVPLQFPKARAGVLICFESIFPELARTMTKNGALLLVNLTNDAWYGMTSAPYQHFSMAVFRAVENRRPLVRAANTGFSAFISAQGKILQASDLFSETALSEEFNLGNPSLTIYSRYGDFFPLALLALVLIHAGHVLYYKIRRKGGFDPWTRKS